MKRVNLWDLVRILAGTALLAGAICVFFNPNGLVTGGFTGVAILVQDFGGRAGFPVPLWLTNTALNVPLFALGLKFFGPAPLRKTLLATAALSGALYLAKFLPAMEGEPLLAAVFGGVTGGLGLGLVFRCQATTGGTDMIAALVHRGLRHVAMPRILLVIDACIILAGLFLYGAVTALYALIAVFVTAKTIDVVLEGLSFSKGAFIISDAYEKISQTILREMDRGVTALAGTGMYTGAAKNVLLCVVSSKEIVRLKDLVRGIDKNAFVIVADVREVLGEGFQQGT
jgi:uncharacterized membrane-anchored protein YitT (DUF2179 family)